MSGVSPLERNDTKANNSSELIKYLEDNYADIIEFTEEYTFVSRSRKKLKINLLGIG